MGGKELITLVSLIQRGNFNSCSIIANEFSKYMRTISYSNGRFDEDCYQELQIQVLLCLLKFKPYFSVNIQDYAKIKRNCS